jgi:peroxiredoxin
VREINLLEPGVEAPDFVLKATPDQEVRLSDLRGQPVILAFYPADFSPVCGDQMAIYNQILDEFRRYHAQILGISVDGVWCHLAFAKDRRLQFPLLADFERKGEVARSYGAYNHKEGVCERALFVLDENGRVFWRYLSPVAVNPGADGILDALDRLRERKQQGEARP